MQQLLSRLLLYNKSITQSHLWIFWFYMYILIYAVMVVTCQQYGADLISDNIVFLTHGLAMCC